MPDRVEIPLCSGPVSGTVRPPGSKSITNRALVCASLARGESLLAGALDSDDTRVMVGGLAALGISVAADWERGELRVSGSDGQIPASAATIDCAASGTTMRFLAAVCALGHGTYRLDGTTRMRQRPIGDLLASLRDLGVDAVAESPGECPPVVIRSSGITGGTVTVRGGTSSQFASGLALAAPCTPRGMQIVFTGQLVSVPYLEMTRQVMEQFGAACVPHAENGWRIEPTGYTACRYAIEPDASAASYFFAAAAITGGTVTVPGLSRRSLQGDVDFCDALERMGCTVIWNTGTRHDDRPEGSITVSGRAAHGIDIDMNAISDTVPTLAAVAVFADGPTTIRNVAHIRDKETDRIGDLVRELVRVGVDARELADGLVITPRHDALRGASIATYDDHRMAMSMSLVGLRVPGIRIEDPGCVGKTFPRYWDTLWQLIAPARSAC
jgi:3-phosphoshikimate 1-carboxyvinyltransferase